MPLSDQQISKLRAEAQARGIDADRLIAAAEAKLGAAKTPAPAPAPSAPAADQPKLFQYHLPFVTVDEVRTVWLGLPQLGEGGDTIAAEWAALHGGGAGGAPPAAVTGDRADAATRLTRARSLRVMFRAERADGETELEYLMRRREELRASGDMTPAMETLFEELISLEQSFPGPGEPGAIE